MCDDVTAAPRVLKTPSPMQWAHTSDFLVAWRDPRTMQECFLGGFSSDDSMHISQFFLALGHADELNEVMLAIHLPLRLCNASKGACDMYLVIPVDALDMHNTNSASSCNTLIPPTTPQLKKAGVQTGEEFVCCHFSLLKAPSRVFMPVPSAQKRPSQHARGLLLSLKSLSEAKSFDIYLRRTPQSEHVLQHFFQKLRNDDAQSPNINWKATFSGREVTNNDWNAYHIYDKETLRADRNPLLEQYPPPYKEAVQATPQDGEEAPFATEFPQHPDFASWPPLTDAPSIPNTETPSCSEDGGEDNSEDLTAARPDEATREGRQKNHQAPEAPQEKVHRERGSQQSRRPKRKADEAGFNSEFVSRACVAVSDHALKYGTKTLDRTAREFGFVLEIREHVLTAPGLLEGTLTTHSSIFHARGPNRTIFNTNDQFFWFCDAVLWLKATWIRQPSVHTACFMELLIMCQAIMLENRELFVKSRERCMDNFLKGKRVTNNKGPWEVKLINRASWICHFINECLGTGTDTLIIDEVQALQHLCNGWQSVGGDTATPEPGHEQEYAKREESVNLQMAACVLVAFCKGSISSAQKLQGQKD